MILKLLLEKGTAELRRAEVCNPESSANFLMREILGYSRAEVFLNLDREISKTEEQKFNSLIIRRAKHEPVWYITGEVEFCDLKLAVDKNVLIPRPETELLVEKTIEIISNFKLQSSNLKSLPEEALTKVGKKSNVKLEKQFSERLQRFKHLEHPHSMRILDLGTGSGAIILALANRFRVQNLKLEVENSQLKPAFSQRFQSDTHLQQLDPLQFFASDVSKEALAVAKKNAQNLGLVKDIKFRQGNFFSPWKGQKFDLIIANLPYIPHEDIAGLSLDIHHWEPRVALDGGKRGLETYKKFFSKIGKYLSDRGTIIIEIGYDQGSEIKKLVGKYLSEMTIKIDKDYADIDRIAVIAQRVAGS